MPTTNRMPGHTFTAPHLHIIRVYAATPVANLARTTCQVLDADHESVVRWVAGDTTATAVDVAEAAERSVMNTRRAHTVLAFELSFSKPWQCFTNSLRLFEGYSS